MTEQLPRPSLLKKLYNHNPFYAISAVMMLYAIRKMYGELVIGEINTWKMMGGLTGYTLVLAVAGWVIVRFGKVWEDARSIIVILLFLFMAISVSADDLMVRIESTSAGTLLIIIGYLFSAFISEMFLFGTRIRLGALYRIPYHLMLASFYIAPWFYSPLQNPRFSDSLEWMLLLFPLWSALLFLLLYPAIRKGTGYVKNNGTPWLWPWYPWTIFGVFALLVSLRSYLLCMAFGPVGPIWNDSGTAKRIVFDSIWGLYYLVPLGFVLLFLVMQHAFLSGNKSLSHKVMLFPLVLVLMSLPIGNGPVSYRFYNSVTDVYSSPLWMTILGAIMCYFWAWIKKVPESGVGLITGLLSLSVISSETVSFNTLNTPVAWPLVVIGVLAFYKGISESSSRYCALASIFLAAGLFLILPDTIAVNYRVLIAVHLLFVSLGFSGLMMDDYFAEFLRMIAGVLGAVLFYLSVISTVSLDVTFGLKFVYSLVLISGTLLVAVWFKTKSFLMSFAGMVFISGYSLVVVGFRLASDSFGQGVVSAFAWSFGALLLAFLISSHKASWLPESLFKKETVVNGDVVET